MVKPTIFHYSISLTILIALIFLAYHILKPFFITIAWSGILSITFYPLYIFFSRHMKQWIASVVTVIIVTIVIAGPCAYIINALIGEATDMYVYLTDNGSRLLEEFQNAPLSSKIMEKLRIHLHMDNQKVIDVLINGLQNFTQYLVKHVSSIFKNIFVFAFQIMLMAFTIFFFLIDGKILVQYIEKLLPFTEYEKAKMGKQVEDMIFATVIGGVIVSIIQGVLGSVTFLILGLSSPVFWGVAMAVAAFLPVIGPFIIWGPASLFLIVQGDIGKGIGLMLLGIFGISMVDQFLKPILIGGKTKLHTLLIFFSVVGGINYFGLIGFILGPIIITLCLSLLKIYAESRDYKSTSFF
jgi:predicted PurR-regulated permease PerM